MSLGRKIRHSEDVISKDTIEPSSVYAGKDTEDLVKSPEPPCLYFVSLEIIYNGTLTAYSTRNSFRR